MNENESIKDYFKGKSKRQVQQLLKRFYKEQQELKQYCENILKDIPEYEEIQNVVYSIVFNIKLRTCKTCGKFLKYSSPKERNFCSCKCAQSNDITKMKMSESISNLYKDKDKSEKIIQKRKQTCIEHYGVEYAFQADEVKNKIKKTNKERYGSENIFNNKEINEKRKESYLKHYGVDHPFKSTEIKNKIKNTLYDRYGIDHPMHSEIFKEKIKSTSLKKYGCEYYLMTDECKEKSKITCIEKYGVNYPMQSETLKEKLKNIFFEKYGCYPIQLNSIKKKRLQNYIKKYGTTSTRLKIGWNTILSWKDYVVPLFTQDEWKGVRNKDIAYKWKCSKCGCEFEQRYISSQYMRNETNLSQYIPRCPNCYPIDAHSSMKEIELLNFVKQYFPNAAKDNILIKPFEIDVLIPEIKLALEFNGSYFHQFLGDKRSN